MNEKFDDKIFKRADGLRKALARHEERLPKLSPDVNARLVNQMNREKPKMQSVRLRLIWAAAASVAILILSVVWSFKQSDGMQTSVNMESRKLTVLNKTDHPKVEKITREENERILLQGELGDKENVVSPKKELARIVEEEEIRSKEPVELTADQKNVTNYIARLTQMCQVDSLPVDCGRVGGGMVYVFPNNEECDIMGRLSMVALWVDTDKPNVNMAFSSDQMTLELKGKQKANSVNDIWLADKRDGMVCLYHAQSRQEEQNWLSASCYMNFLAESETDRSGK